MATKIKSKGWTIVFFTIPSIVGTIIMLTVSREKKGVLLFGYYLVGFGNLPQWTTQLEVAIGIATF